MSLLSSIRLIALLTLLLCRPSGAFAQRAENLPISVNDLPFILDVTGARQRVTFEEPVYARLWSVITQGGVSRIRGEIILTQANETILYKALLARRDFFHGEREPVDNNRLRLEMDTPVPNEPESYTTWTGNEGLVFPPLRATRVGGVDITVHNPPALPLDTDHVVLAINEAIEDSNSIQIDTRRIEVKIRFSKSALQSLTKQRARGRRCLLRLLFIEP